MNKYVLALLTSVISISMASADVKVGLLLGFTGPVANEIPRQEGAVNLATKNITEQGGFFKDGQKLQIVNGDSACDPVAAVDAAKKLVDVSQVLGIVGPNCSGAAIAQADSVSIPAGVVSIAVSSTSPAITTLEQEKGTDLMFRVVPSDAYQGVALADLAIKKGYNEIAVMYSNDDYNAAISRVFVKAFEERGGKVVANQAFDPGKNSYRSEVATLGKDTKNLALFAYHGNGGIIIMRNAFETGSFTHIIGGDAMRNNDVIDQLGAENLANVTFTTTAADQGSQAYKKWVKLAEDFGILPDEPFTANAYDALFLLALAIEKVGEKDRSKIAPALRDVANAPGEVIYPGEWAKAKKILAEGGDIHYIGGSGKVDFDENGDVEGLYSANSISPEGKWVVEILR